MLRNLISTTQQLSLLSSPERHRSVSGSEWQQHRDAKDWIQAKELWETTIQNNCSENKHTDVLSYWAQTWTYFLTTMNTSKNLSA